MKKIIYIQLPYVEALNIIRLLWERFWLIQYNQSDNIRYSLTGFLDNPCKMKTNIIKITYSEIAHLRKIFKIINSTNCKVDIYLQNTVPQIFELSFLMSKHFTVDYCKMSGFRIFNEFYRIISFVDLCVQSPHVAYLPINIYKEVLNLKEELKPEIWKLIQPLWPQLVLADNEIQRTPLDSDTKNQGLLQRLPSIPLHASEDTVRRTIRKYHSFCPNTFSKREESTVYDLLQLYYLLKLQKHPDTVDSWQGRTSALKAIVLDMLISFLNSIKKQFDSHERSDNDTFDSKCLINESVKHLFDVIAKSVNFI